MQLTSVNAPPLDGGQALPLKLCGDLNTPRQNLYDNCRVAMQSGYPQLQERGVERQEPLCVVGSSPNVGKHLDELAERVQAGAHVMAVKGAHDWLLARGITPTYAVAADAQRERAKIFRNRRQGITYLLASQMHPDTWDWMRGYSVMIWHPIIDDGTEQRSRPEWQGIRRVYGGVTTGLRAICLGWLLGYQRQTLFGFESSVSHGRMRADGSGTDDGDPAFPVAFAGRWFLCTTSLAQQTVDLMGTLQQCPGIKIDAVGDGALPHVLATGKQLGWPV